MSNLIEREAVLNIITEAIRDQDRSLSKLKERVEQIPEGVVRCKECKWFTYTVLGMDYACLYERYGVDIDTGTREEHYIASNVWSPEHFCSWGERREDGNINKD